MIFAELKSETGKLTDSQLGWLGLLGRVPSICVYVWRPSDFDTAAAILQRRPTTAQPDSRAQEPQDAASALSGVSLDVAAQESHCGGKNGGK